MKKPRAGSETQKEQHMREGLVGRMGYLSTSVERGEREEAGHLKIAGRSEVLMSPRQPSGDRTLTKVKSMASNKLLFLPQR